MNNQSRFIVVICIKTLIITSLLIAINIGMVILNRINLYKDINKLGLLKETTIVENCLKDISNKKIDYIPDVIKNKVIDAINKNSGVGNYGDTNNLINNMYLDNSIDKYIKKQMISRCKSLKIIGKIRKEVISNSKYFPIRFVKGEKTRFNYIDSWNASRSYGGNRYHEGTDIMDSNNEEGTAPIISIGDGIIVKKGWLELGGYRLYIKMSDNVYAYYAHLDSYETGLEEGDTVYAGQILGYMGNTGYGQEGTKGKFDVHLHFGIYYKDENNEEIAINPYYLLKFLENNKLSYKK